MIELIIAIIIGIIIGTFTGTTPGIHVNTIGVFIFIFSDKILNYTTPQTLATFFVSVAICHAMLEFLPSLLIGVPNEDTVLSVQPGHKLLFQGKARKAIRIVSFGGYGSIIILSLLMPILMIILPLIYYSLENYIGYLLIIVMFLMIYYFNKNNMTRLIALLIFLASGILGFMVLNSGIGNSLGLLCLLTGMFSTSSLIYSLSNESEIPKQNENTAILIDKNFKRSMFAGSISGCILGLLPGLGPAQGSVIAQFLTFNKNISAEEFLVTNSGVNVSDTLFSLLAIYLINNPRSAISVYVSQILENIGLIEIIFFIFVSIVVVSISLIICIKLGDFMIDNIRKINYQYLCKGIILFVSSLIVGFCFFTGGCLWYVLLCYITSIAMGLLPHYLGLSKSNLMGVLILPSIITYLGLV